MELMFEPYSKTLFIKSPETFPFWSICCFAIVKSFIILFLNSLSRLSSFLIVSIILSARLVKFVLLSIVTFCDSITKLFVAPCPVTAILYLPDSCICNSSFKYLEPLKVIFALNGSGSEFRIWSFSGFSVHFVSFVSMFFSTTNDRYLSSRPPYFISPSSESSFRILFMSAVEMSGNRCSTGWNFPSPSNCLRCKRSLR